MPLLAHQLLSLGACALTGLAILFAGVAALRTQLRWFVAGAAIWLPGAIVLKGLAATFTFGLLHRVEPQVGAGAYVALLTLHSGVLTAVFEPGVTLLAGLWFRSLTLEPKRMIAVGVGAGAAEALFLAGLGLLELFGRTLGPHAASGAWSQELDASSQSFAYVLVPVIERLLAAAAHTGARVLVLTSIAERRASLFAAACALMGTMDAWAAFGKAEHVALAWVELGFVPAAAVSVAVVLWRLRPRPHWNTPMNVSG